ncbi:hypothetical protein CPB84DRAFT_1326676 [Gymnopilus junonius]|uniref:DUF6593 domain-containing protein n=1 Tax=Gymnopilus junonius TaxID=109634 RepID=A0A9P5NKM6_GYMJU|nr:hypothetical protein CPB84DRAFT_1326676 [Gymnopilus junonius]
MLSLSAVSSNHLVPRSFSFSPFLFLIRKASSNVMHMNHPFGSWTESGQGGSSVSPTFGALPYPSDPTCSYSSFYFSSFHPDVMNCVVVGPQGQQLYQVVTDKDVPGYTVIKKADGSNISLIEWKSRPLIEIRGLLSKQPVGTWLGLSGDKRAMTVRDIEYNWAPRGKSINMYVGVPKNPILLVKITRKNGAIQLDMSSDAIQLGLLDSVVTAAFLLQCGRNID